MAITKTDGGVIFTDADTHVYQLLIWRAGLKLELKGMRHSGGAIRPRIAAALGLKPRQSRETFIEAIEAKLKEARRG